MILIEERPKLPAVSKYVDRYQFFIISEPAFLKTIPNAKIECYFVKKGGFHQWDVDSESFIWAGSSGILPATNQASFYHIPSCLVCLNIKLNLNILGLSLFSGLLTNWQSFDTSKLIPPTARENILSELSESNTAIQVDALDSTIGHSLDKFSVDEKIDRVISLIESSITGKFKVAELSDSIHMSEKSMERWIRKEFNLAPKELWQVIRFQNASRKLKNRPNMKFIDALEFGYYDQSHFIKECRKMTSYSPKELFSKMKLPTNDIVFE